MSDVSGANIRLGATADGAISELERLRARFALFSREVNTNVTQSFRAASDAQAEYRKGLIQLSDKLTDIGKKLALFVSLPALFAGQQAYKDFANVQRLERGLAQYGETLEKVRRLAKEPNIGVFDGAKALIGLRAARIEAGLAERAVRSFANAITLGGGNSADLEPALFNLKQFKATQHINQVDLRQLANRVPQTMEALERAFGTTDTSALNALGIDKFLEGFISELEKLPKVAGGASVAMEQLSDSATFFSAAFGEGLDKTFGISDKISRLGGFLDNLTTNFQALNPEAQKSVVWFTSLSVIIPALMITIGALIRGWAALAVAAKVGIAAMTIPQFFLVASVITGIGLAIGGAVVAYKLLTNETAEYKRQQEEVNNLAPKVQPLLDKYDDLKKNAGESTEKQRELKSVIQQIAELVPSAVTQWDEYGRAIDINKGKVISFTAEMKKAFAAMAPMRRAAIVTELSGYETRRAELERQLREGTKQVNTDMGMGVYTQQTVKISYEELKKAAVELQQVSAKIVEGRKELLSMGVSGIKDDVKGFVAIQQERNRLAAELAKLKRADKDGNRWISTNDLAQINSLTNKIHALDEQIAKQRVSVGGAAREWNAAVKDNQQNAAKTKNGKGTAEEVKLTAMSVTQLEDKIKSLTEAYDQLSPATADYSRKSAQLLSDLRAAQTRYEALKKPVKDITQAHREKNDVTKTMTELERKLYLINLSKKHLEQAEAVKRETREYKELVGVISNYNLKTLESRKLTGRLSGVNLRGNYVPNQLQQGMGYYGAGSAEMNAIAAAQTQLQRGAVNSPERNKSNIERLKDIADSGTKKYLADYKSQKVEDSEMTDAFRNISKKEGESFEEYQDRVQRIVQMRKQANAQISASIRQTGAEAGVAFGELIGDLINGENALDSFKSKILTILGSLLKDIGKSLIALGLAGEAFKFFKAKPALAIAAGIALTAAGAVVANSAQKKVNAAKLAKGGAVFEETPAIVGDNPGARFDPEIVAPYSKVHNSLRQSIKELLPNVGSNGGSQTLTAVVKGQDLLILLERARISNKGLRAKPA